MAHRVVRRLLVLRWYGSSRRQSRFRDRLGREAHGYLLGNLLYLLVCRVMDRGGTGHDVAVDVSTGGKRGEQRFINAMNGGVQIAFQDAV